MPIAIIGLACLFPGAPDLKGFWHNIINGIDAITEVPAGRWDAGFYDPGSTAIDRFYCRRGGFVDDYACFDPLPFGIMPKTTEAIEPDQLLTLKIGYEALHDAGYTERPFPRERTGVIIGRGNYVSAGVLRLEQHVRLLPQIMQTLKDLFPDLPEQTLDIVRAQLRQEFSYYGPDVAAGLIPNLTASRLANRLDLHGPAYTVDAACASSLIALEGACRALERDEADMMMAGGVHLTHDLTFWATFCQLGALSRTGMARPLAKDADGILAGEGVGVAVLKRLDDAHADGDRIYAVIDGVGSSSDGRSASLVAPSVKGQAIALEKAWAHVPFGREAIGLVEAHGTGTPAGDAVELETLAAFFGPHLDSEEPRPVIGSVKSMIGHTMPASGMASLIKAALSIYHGILPPTLHCDVPHPRLADTRFRVIGRTEPWRHAREQRVAAINAFGFGGINAHVVLRGLPENTVAPTAPPLPDVLLLSADTPEELLDRLDRGERDLRPRPGPCRLAVIEPNAKKLATARKAVAAGKPWHGRQQVWFSPYGLIAGGGKLAFLFPGVDSTFAPQTADLAAYFCRPVPPYCEAADPAQSLMKVVLGLLGFNRYLFQILGSLGLRADVYAGHSIGEWSAMLCAGMMDQNLSDRTNANLDLDSVRFPDVLFLACGCDAIKLRAAMDGLDDIALSHDNCPHQVIACGAREKVMALAERLSLSGVMTQVLPIVSGFHSPLFADHMEWYREFFGSAELVEPEIPVWSAATAQKFPSDLAGKRKLALDHLLQPVRFRELIKALYEDGSRIFVQVGTGSLPGFVNDTLSGLPHQAISANTAARGGLAQLQQLCVALWVEGAVFDTRLLTSSTPDIEAAAAGTQTLSLGVPLVRLRQPLKPAMLGANLHSGSAPAQPVATDRIGHLIYDTLSDIEEAGREVLGLWHRHHHDTGQSQRRTHALDAMPRFVRIQRTIPSVRGHNLYPQRKGWPIIADWHPVVPMTMEVMLVREAVEEALPGMLVVEVSNIQAYNWLAVPQEINIDITLQSLEDGTIDAEIVGFFKARVSVAPDYPRPDLMPAPALVNRRDTEVDAASLYKDGWMFHGPEYQGVVMFRGIGENGIDGTLQVPVGKGALLDNMGQLAGYWVMEQPNGCLAMPIAVDRIRFYAPDPLPGAITQAQVRITRLDQLTCVSDHQLRDAEGRLCIVIEGWQTRRYQMDKAFWSASRRLCHLQVSTLIPPNVALFEDLYDTALLRDYISRRYLTAAERRVYDNLPPKRRRQWLAGRVAAKDAVRAFVRRQREDQAVYPQELCIENDAAGAPYIRANVTATVPDSLCVSISHKATLAVAIVDVQPVGIDIETIEPRDAGFLQMVFNDAELALLAGENAAAAHTRGWVVKEVAAKMAGTGLGGKLHKFVIEERNGDCFRVNGHWIVTHPLRDCILGWSLGDTVPDTGSAPLAEAVAAVS